MSFWKQKISPEVILFFVFLIVVAAASAAHLVTVPRVFFDEGITVEVARNFQLFSVPDILTAPGQFSGFPYINGSSGYPIFAPLAVFFKFFDFGFVQARIYALGWLLLSLAIIWTFVKRFWNATYATAALALVAGFASLHDSGRRVLGDVPGFALMLLGLIFLLKKDKAYLAGILFGLAVATKPSVYLLIVPALVLTYIIADWRTSFRRLLPIGIGATVPVFFWVLLQFPHPLLLSTWSGVLEFYRNSFGSSYSPWASILHNLRSFGSQTSLIYFALLAVPTTLAFREKLAKRDLLVMFLFIYGFFDLLYFLKSTGTIRYLLPLELLLLLLFPATASWVIPTLQSRIIMLRRIPRRVVWLTMISGLTVLHLVQFLYFSSVVAKNTSHLHTLRFLARYRTETIGVMSSPHIAAFIAPERKLHYLRETDQIIFGTNPLDLPTGTLPDVLVIPTDYELSNPYTKNQSETLKRYSLVFESRWSVYELNPD